MKKMLLILAGAALSVALITSLAAAGLNAGSTAKLYWQNGTTTALTARNSTIGTPQLLVTFIGINNFRGADVQISINALDYSGVPPAWQGNGTGGCNDGNWTFYAGGRNGATSTLYPNIFTTSPAVTGIATSQNQEYYNVPNNCITAHGTALLWLSSAGAIGVARVPTTEYGVWAIKFDVSGTVPCDGDINSPVGMCFNPFKRSPCTDVQRDSACTVLDGNLQKDFPMFVPGFIWLTWEGDVTPQYPSSNCPAVTPAPAKSWGELKRLYR